VAAGLLALALVGAVVGAVAVAPLCAVPAGSVAWAANSASTNVSATIDVAAFKTFGKVLGEDTHAPIAQAQVIIAGTTEDGRGFTRTTFTDSDGLYVFPGVPLGTYDIRVRPPNGSDYLSAKVASLHVDHNDYQVPTIYLASTKKRPPSGNLAHTGERLGAIALIVISALVFLGLIFLILFFLLRRRKHDDDPDE
jgi:hypothetical protein